MISAMEAEEMSEQIKTNKLSEQIKTKKVSEQIETEKMPEQIGREKMTDQIEIEKISEQIGTEKMSEQIGTEKMSEQNEIEKMYFRDPVESGKMPWETIETEQMLSKLPVADKMSMMGDDEVKTEKRTECDVCMANSDDQTTQLPIASKRCLECKQNLCDSCLRDHRRFKPLVNHPIEDIPTCSQHQNNAEDVMTEIRKERDRLKKYEVEMTNHVDHLLKAQELTNAKADNIMETEKVSEQIEIEKMAEQIEIEKMSEQIGTENMSEQIETNKPSEQIGTENMSEQIETNKPSEQIETEKMSEQIEIDKMAEQIEIEKMSEQTGTEKMPEQIETEKMPEQIGREKMAEQIEIEKISEQIGTEKMSEQNEIEKMYFRDPVESGKMPWETIETEQMLSKLPVADKMSMMGDDEVKTEKRTECDVCMANSDDQTTQLPIASKRCLECKQNLCDSCLRDHRRFKPLVNHPIEDIPTCSQHQNNAEDVMTEIRKERDRLQKYEVEMTNHVDHLLKAQEVTNTNANDITKMILKKHSECLARLEGDKKYLLEKLDSRKKEIISENETKLEEAISYLKKITDRRLNFEEILKKGSVDSNSESIKSLLLHIHFQRPMPSLDSVSFCESSFSTGTENILGRLEGLINPTKTQTETTLESYRLFLWNAYSVAEDTRKIHWKMTIPNEIEMKNLYDLKILQGVQNELKLRGDDKKLDDLQAKHVRIVSLLHAVTRPTSSEKLESHLTELQGNIERLWNIIEFQIQYKNSEKGLIPEGFQNHGNTCYFNAVLQCLLQTVLLPFELTVNIYGLENVSLKENKEMYHLSKAFMNLAYNYNEPGQRQGSLRTLYTEFKVSTQRFNDQAQHDSHDLLIHFLDKLRIEARNAWKMPSTGPELQKLPTAVDQIFGGQFITVYTCHRCDENYAIREPFLDISIPLCTLTVDEQKPEENKSKPTTPFWSEIYVRFNAKVEQTTSGTSDAESESPSSCEIGRPISTSSATDAKKDSSTTEIREVVKKILQPIGVEVLEEPDTTSFWSRRTTLNPTVSQCLTYFTRAENINDEYLCGNCQTPDNDDLTMTSATKRTLISSPPAVLVLHLKRFEQKSTGFVKRDEMISYDEFLDLGPFCSSSALRIDPEEENVWYSLYAVVIHRGFFLSRGHYVAYVKQRDSSAQLEDQLREKFLQKNFGDQEKVPNDDDLAALEKREAIGKRVKVKRPIPIPGQWFYVSDDSVRCCDTKEALNQKAFLLFYERIPCCYHKTTSV